METVVEINGVKLEVDLRDAKVINNYKIGDSVKILVKEYDSFKPYPGVIVGFDNFKTLPTIIVAYIKIQYNTAAISFAYINNESKDYELCPASNDKILFEKVRVIELLDMEIIKTQEALLDLERKKEYFLRQFGAYFKDEGQN